ncbi:MAG: PqqD family protein [Chloroflexi bacterium]|nr:PqqD family protein [Chloroflexota bacterium]
MISMEHPRVNYAKVVCETIDGEVILVNMGNGCYYSLVDVAAAIWACIEQEVPLEMIATTLVDKYTGNTAAITETVQGFIAELYAEGLIIQGKNGVAAKPTGRPADGATMALAEKPLFAVPELHKYTDMQDLLWLDPIHEVDEAGWPNINKAALENND